jgi:hypothetical protein
MIRKTIQLCPVSRKHDETAKEGTDEKRRGQNG